MTVRDEIRIAHGISRAHSCSRTNLKIGLIGTAYEEKWRKDGLRRRTIGVTDKLCQSEGGQPTDDGPVVPLGKVDNGHSDSLGEHLRSSQHLPLGFVGGPTLKSDRCETQVRSQGGKQSGDGPRAARTVAFS